MYRIGIDFGGTNIAVGIVNEHLEVLYKSSLPTKKDERSVDEIVADMATLCLKMVDKVGIGLSQADAIGIASPGVVNSKTGVVEYYCGMNMNHYPMAAILSEKLGGYQPIYMENDANAAALGEVLAGAARGAKNALMITLGTGVGGGIIVGGKLLAGVHGSGGEIGHLKVRAYESEACGCGKHGCLEQYASATGIVREANRRLTGLSTPSTLRELEQVTAKDVFDAAKGGDALAMDVVKLFGDTLGRALANVSCVCDPEVFVIGGGVSAAGQIILDAVSEAFRKHAFPAAEETRFELAALGNDAGICGAARLVLDV